MAWTEQLPSGRYRGCYRNADGEKRRLPGTFVEKAEALRKAGAKEDEQRQVGAVDPKASKITYGAWFDEWMSSHSVEKTTEREYRSSARLHILPYWEEKSLDEITLMGGKKWVKALQDPQSRHKGLWAAKKSKRSPWTIRIAVQVLSASLNAAVPPSARVLPVNPIKGLTWPDLPEGIERYLTPSEVEAITFHMSKPINRLIVWTTVTSGMRAGEIGGLHIPRIDLVRGGIEVIEQYDQAFNIIKPLPKDDQKRYVPIPMDVAEMLADHIKTLPKAKNCGVEHESGRCPGGVLPFRGPRNAPFRSSEWGKGPWQAALDLAEIEGRVRFHDLRHTFASWAIQRGVPFGDLAEVMGHSSWEVTKKYAHLAENRHDTVREALTKGYTEARGAARGAQAGVTQLSPVSPGAAENSA